MEEFTAAMENSQASVDMYARLVPGGDANRAVAIALRARIAEALGRPEAELFAEVTP